MAVPQHTNHVYTEVAPRVQPNILFPLDFESRTVVFPFQIPDISKVNISYYKEI
jgi:hypothetical protein